MSSCPGEPSTAGFLAASPLHALVIEARGHIRPPRRYLSQYGQFLEHAPYSERDLRGPDGPLLAEGEDVPVIVRNRDGLTRLTYAYHPFDVVGWDGCLYPYAFNIADFEPIVKRTHAPPPVHQTFEGPNFVICSFCPRPLDFDDGAVPIPYNHHNVDSDEMMYYVAGDYSARKGSGVGIGSITLHPSGCTHGPQPGAVEAAVRGLQEGRTSTDETAVMIDTFRPLLLGPASRQSRGPGVRLELGKGRPRLTGHAADRRRPGGGGGQPAGGVRQRRIRSVVGPGRAAAPVSEGAAGARRTRRALAATSRSLTAWCCVSTTLPRARCASSLL